MVWGMAISISARTLHKRLHRSDTNDLVAPQGNYNRFIFCHEEAESFPMGSRSIHPDGFVTGNSIHLRPDECFNCPQGPF